jgi:hypothetical protein
MVPGRPVGNAQGLGVFREFHLNIILQTTIYNYKINLL